MLIIFDLDDTLIDTSGSLTPHRLKRAFERMREAGFATEEPQQALEMLQRLNETAKSARAALAEFTEIHQLGEEFFRIGIQEMYENPLIDIPLPPLDGAPELLRSLSLSHPLALVTLGLEEIQREKMKKAGIDSTFFSKIIVSSEQSKKPHYRVIMELLGYPPAKTFVCGDRVEGDLLPAKELGCRTVRVKRGRGLNDSSPPFVVDHTIAHLKEIEGILHDHQ